MKIPRILLAAGASGSGKTLITCGLLQALKNRGMTVASFKCGPDYIDPMFHSRVIGTKSGNLDTFFTSDEDTRQLLLEGAKDCQIAVLEGVMGYYDGVGGTTTKASAYDLASVTDTPVILIVNSKGMSLSLAAYIKGFLEYRKDSHIRGVILNQMSPMLYPRMKEHIENELGIPVLGYVPKVEHCVIESRHLGLVLPDEIPELKKRLLELTDILEKTLDMDGILKLAEEAPEFPNETGTGGKSEPPSEKVRLGVAEDEAFCFIYRENLRLLEQLGAELVPFSPIHDRQLPENLDGLLLYGGYPELYGKELEANISIREEIARVLEDGMPCMAECGGFMYLHEELKDMNGVCHRMVGRIPGKTFYTGKLSRFGYVYLEKKDSAHMGRIPAHEFHYYDSENCGEAYRASKPVGKRGWDCMHDDGRLLAGFPHLYYYGNQELPKEFLGRCLTYKKEKQEGAERL